MGFVRLHDRLFHSLENSSARRGYRLIRLDEDRAGETGMARRRDGQAKASASYRGRTATRA